MSLRIDVKTDVSEVRRTLSALGPGVDRAASRALNKTMTTVRAEAARDIKKERNLKIGLIKSSLDVRRATFRRLSTVMTASGQPIPIRHFGASLTKKGVTVRIKQGGKRTLLRASGRPAFTNTGSKLGPNVFVRESKSRLPIRKWPPVPGIPRVFEKQVVMNRMKTTARRIWPQRFNQELRFEVEKAVAKARRS